MIQIFKQIGLGFINGFPLIQSIRKNIKGVRGTLKEIPAEPTIENPEQTEKQPFNYVSLITEICTVGLIVTFVFHKINIEDLKYLLQIIKN